MRKAPPPGRRGARAEDTDKILFPLVTLILPAMFIVTSARARQRDEVLRLGVDKALKRARGASDRTR
jgi:hypothetical protein